MFSDDPLIEVSLQKLEQNSIYIVELLSAVQFSIPFLFLCASKCSSHRQSNLRRFCSKFSEAHCAVTKSSGSKLKVPPFPAFPSGKLPASLTNGREGQALPRLACLPSKRNPSKNSSCQSDILGGYVGRC